MTGHQPIIDLRKRGIMPAVVFVDYCFHNPNWLDLGEQATVGIDSDENPATADLRWCIGLTIVLSVNGLERAKKWHRAIVAAGAKRVITNVHDEVLSYKNLMKIVDTEGVFSWQR